MIILTNGIFHCVYTILVFAEKCYKPNTLCIYVMLFLNLGNYSFYFGEGNGTPLQYSCLRNRMDRGAWWVAVHKVEKSRTRLNDFTFTFHFSLSCIGEGNGNPLQCSCLEKPRDGGAWWAAVYGVAQSWTRLKRLSSSSSSMYPYLLLLHLLFLCRSLLLFTH